MGVIKLYDFLPSWTPTEVTAQPIKYQLSNVPLSFTVQEYR